MIGSGKDFDSNPIAITFGVGEVSKRVNVSIIADTVVEVEESFRVNLQLNSSSSQVSKGRGNATIQIIDSTSKLS